MFVSCQIVTRYGGSIRCLVSKKKEISENLNKLIQIEKDRLIDNSNNMMNLLKNSKV